MKSTPVTITLPADLAERVNRVRSSRSIGGAAPPLSAVLRACVAAGVGALETPINANATPSPEAA